MEILNEPNRILYITKNGKKIHLRKNCLTLKNSNIIETKIEDIDRDKYSTICQKCEIMEKKVFKSQVPFIPNRFRNNLLSISSINQTKSNNNISTSEYEAIPDDFSNNITNNNYKIIKNNMSNNKSNNNNNINNIDNNISNINNNSNNQLLNNNNLINNNYLFNNNSNHLLNNNNNNLFSNNSIHNNNTFSISKKEPSFVNKSKTQNNDILHFDDNSIENIYIEEEQESSIIDTNKKNEIENEQIKLNFDIEKKKIEYKKGDNVQFNFNQNFIFYFEIEVIVKNKFCKMSTGFSIIYLDDQDNESYEINKLIHNFSIENNTKINYLINLKEGFYNYDIQENSKETKKKKLLFHKINLSKIFYINPYIKFDKENECEYFFNNERIKYEIKK